MLGQTSRHERRKQYTDFQAQLYCHISAIIEEGMLIMLTGIAYIARTGAVLVPQYWYICILHHMYSAMNIAVAN